MIPSSPRRSGLFLLLSCALFFGPDLLVPDAWSQTPVYLRFSMVYQGLLVLAGFAWGPAICRRMLVGSLENGFLRGRVDDIQSGLAGLGRRPPSVILATHPIPFILTVGLLPAHCETFLSTGLAGRLSAPALRFLLARAAAHAAWPQRLADVLPALAVTLWLPDEPTDLAAWGLVGAVLAGWLLLHWGMELAADRMAGRAMPGGARDALLEVVAATRTPLDRLLPRVPQAWRLRALEAGPRRVTKAS